MKIKFSDTKLKFGKIRRHSKKKDYVWVEVIRKSGGYKFRLDSEDTLDISKTVDVSFWKLLYAFITGKGFITYEEGN